MNNHLLDDDKPLKDILSLSCDIVFGDREHSDSKSDCNKKQKTIIKPIPPAMKDHPLIFCKSCGVELQEDDQDLCANCKERQQPRKYFKGIVGLQDLPMERIAMLPAWARELYLKHMDLAEVDEFRKYMH